MHSGDTVVKRPHPPYEVGEISSQSWMWLEGCNLVFFKKGLEDIPSRGNSMFKGVEKSVLELAKA